MKTIKPKKTMLLTEPILEVGKEAVVDGIGNYSLLRVEPTNKECLSEYVLKKDGVACEETIKVKPVPPAFEVASENTVESLMDSIIQEKEQNLNANEVKVEFTLTKRQFSIWDKKGGVKWLKKKLV